MSQFSVWSHCNYCNLSNMEYKQSKYIWNQQLEEPSAGYVSFNSAMHIHIQSPVTVFTSWRRFMVQVIALPDTLQTLHGKKTNKKHKKQASMRMF